MIDSRRELRHKLYGLLHTMRQELINAGVDESLLLEQAVVTDTQDGVEVHFFAATSKVAARKVKRDAADDE